MSTDIWQQLVQGKPLDTIGIPTIDGRLDLRNLHVEPYAVETLRMQRWKTAEKACRNYRP